MESMPRDQSKLQEYTISENAFEDILKNMKDNHTLICDQFQLFEYMIQYFFIILLLPLIKCLQ